MPEAVEIPVELTRINFLKLPKQERLQSFDVGDNLFLDRVNCVIEAAIFSLQDKRIPSHSTSNHLDKLLTARLAGNHLRPNR